MDNELFENQEDILNQRWDEILNHMKEEYNISDPSFRTFIKILSVHSVEGTKLTILIDDVAIGNSKSFIEKKYGTFLSVSIEELTGIHYDISFLSLAKLDSRGTTGKPEIRRKHTNASLNPRYTFDTFIVGDNNNFAHAAALKVAEQPGNAYNPFYIYGGPGLGKTHLMQAIANYIEEHDDTKKVMYVTSETFTNEILDAIREGHSENSISTQEFRSKYRNVDVLLIDDIQFIIGKEATQLEFFHTFNHLYESQKQIIITSDKHPSMMTNLEERLSSRFEMGLTADVKAPTYETRMAILQRKIEEEGANIDNSVLDYIAKNIISNIRELQGAINKVISISDIHEDEITLEEAKKALIDIINPNMKHQITIDYILETVADHFGITVKDLLSKERTNAISYPRHICMYLCRKMTNSTSKEIGTKIGNRDHSTVLHGVEAITRKLENKEEETTQAVNLLMKKIDPK